MKHFLLMTAFVALAACATTPVYGPAKSDRSQGYLSQKIEDGRHRISYSDTDPARARSLALLRASEITLSEGRDWFEVTSESMDSGRSGSPGGGPRISVGGSAGSGGSSSVGVGIGVGFPLGGGGGGLVTQSLEIVTGTGAKPDKAEAYDARAVEQNLRPTAP
jgi:hypothetical protein